MTPAQAVSLKKHAVETLEKRMRLPLAKLIQRPSSELFFSGYDLWRDCDAIKKITHRNTLAALASELFQIPTLRLGFDQVVLIDPHSTSPFAEKFSLQETSCLSPLPGALILPLEDLSSPLPFFPMPLKIGNGLFLSSTMPIPWPELFSTPGLQFFMIGFAAEKTFFLGGTRDPHAVTLKKLGYVFNDLLKNSLHPILLKKSQMI